MKTCISCIEPKPPTAFWPSRFTADGLASTCKTCMRIRAQRDLAERDRRRAARTTAEVAP